MLGYVYEETAYISDEVLDKFEDLMSECEFAPEEIDDINLFQSVLMYLFDLTNDYPNFLQPYEYALKMIDVLTPTKELQLLGRDIRFRWFESCEEIAKKDDIFNQQVLWGFMENRPLIRGLFNRANQLWEKGSIEEAHDLFLKIYNTNKEEDNIGARYSVKATAEKMSFKEFNKRFTYEDSEGSFYKDEELSKWFGNGLYRSNQLILTKTLGNVN